MDTGAAVMRAAHCIWGGEKYVHEISGPGAGESGYETDPQEVSGERAK
jgi:hypothetical protein